MESYIISKDDLEYIAYVATSLAFTCENMSTQESNLIGNMLLNIVRRIDE